MSATHFLQNPAQNTEYTLHMEARLASEGVFAGSVNTPISTQKKRGTFLEGRCLVWDSFGDRWACLQGYAEPIPYPPPGFEH